MIETPAARRADLPRPVGIGEALVDVAGSTLVAYGLGSCVGLAAWDPVTRIGGLAHFMLPSGARDGDPAKYVDTGLPWFLAALSDAGASPSRMHLKAAGGAAMFGGMRGSLEIGRRNIVALETALAAAGFQLTAQDLGGAVGRTIVIDLTSGRFSVRTVHGTSTL